MRLTALPNSPCVLESLESASDRYIGRILNGPWIIPVYSHIAPAPIQKPALANFLIKIWPSGFEFSSDIFFYTIGLDGRIHAFRGVESSLVFEHQIERNFRFFTNLGAGTASRQFFAMSWIEAGNKEFGSGKFLLWKFLVETLIQAFIPHRTKELWRTPLKILTDSPVSELQILRAVGGKGEIASFQALAPISWSRGFPRCQVMERQTDVRIPHQRLWSHRHHVELSVGGHEGFRRGDYGLIADVKMMASQTREGLPIGRAFWRGFRTATLWDMWDKPRLNSQFQI